MGTILYQGFRVENGTNALHETTRTCTGRNVLQDKMDRQLGEIREFMQIKGIPHTIRQKVDDYMQVT